MKILWILLAFFVKFSFQGKCPLNSNPAPAITISGTCITKPTFDPNCRKYRTIDGTWNNMRHPLWGASNRPFARIVDPNYGDGISSMPLSISGCDLPNARLVSSTVFPERDISDPQFTIANMQFGQYLAHDIGFQKRKTSKPFMCCSSNGIYNYCDPFEEACSSIEVPYNDPIYKNNMTCLNFVRSITDRDLHCQKHRGRRPKPVQQINFATSFIDHSATYSTTLNDLAALRSFQNGKLSSVTKNGIEWPLQQAYTPTTCAFAKETCFQTGDGRSNNNPGLILYHIYFMMEHNRIATELLKVNPTWGDETLFQVARAINIGILQNIVYYEYLPNILGRNYLIDNGLIVEDPPCGYISDYDPWVDPRIWNEFSTGAFRYFHTEIEGQLKLMDNKRTSKGSIFLRDNFDRPKILEKDNGNYYRWISAGMCTQPQQSADINFSSDIKNYLFRREPDPFGEDLRAIDIQRGRDHGVGTYNDLREYCGLKRASSWKDLEKEIPKVSIEKLKKVYEHPNDVDLTVGGSLENKLPGSLVGTTFSCIITEQFHKLRVGDRFFFESPKSGFTKDQLNEIRKSSISRIFCDHGKVGQIQPKAFQLRSPRNEIVDCSKIPTIDFKKWKI